MEWVCCKTLHPKFHSVGIGNDINTYFYIAFKGRRGRDRMVVGFTTTCAISGYHHLSCKFEPRTCRSVPDTCYVMKFISDLWQVGGFLREFRFPLHDKTDRHNITEIVSKMALNTTMITINCI